MMIQLVIWREKVKRGSQMARWQEREVRWPECNNVNLIYWHLGEGVRNALTHEGVLAHEPVTNTQASERKVSRVDKLIGSSGDPHVQSWLLDQPHLSIPVQDLTSREGETEQHAVYKEYQWENFCWKKRTAKTMNYPSQVFQEDFYNQENWRSLRKTK